MSDFTTLTGTIPGAPSLRVADAVADPKTATISFNVTAGTVLTIMPDGKLIRGEGFASDHAASVAFMDVLSQYVPSFISELRARAERAEAELVRLKAT